MSDIPYYFETPIPKYFREAGWLENEHMFKFITWAFMRCSTRPHTVVLNGKEITLAPYEFIAGRLTSSKECFLTENIFRNQLISMQKAGLLKKSTNSLTNHYTCYIWATERFCKTNNQQNNQPITNRQPTVNHNPDIKNTRRKKEEKEAKASKKNQAIWFNRTTNQFENLTPEFLSILKETYPNKPIEKEFGKMKMWLIDPKNPIRQGNRQFIVNWLENANPIEIAIKKEENEPFVLDEQIQKLIKRRDEQCKTRSQNFTTAESQFAEMEEPFLQAAD